MAQGTPPVLRGRGLEIVDDAGRCAREHRDPAGRSEREDAGRDDRHHGDPCCYRLVNSKGRPNVKIAAHERGAGALIAGDTDPTWVQILAENGNTAIRLSNQDGRSRLIAP
jgi:hypothetical protein